MKKFLSYLLFTTIICACGGGSDEDVVSEQDSNQSQNPNPTPNTPSPNNPDPSNPNTPNIPPSNGDTRNTLPSIPRLIEPQNLSLCIVQDQPFEFRSTDSDGDTVEYKVEIARDLQFTDIFLTETTTDPTRLYDLEEGETYYWHVKASDGVGESQFSETFAFYTEGQGEQNFVPFVNMVEPRSNSSFPESTRQITLSWQGNDILGDVNQLRYDIRFGINNG